MKKEFLTSLMYAERLAKKAIKQIEAYTQGLSLIKQDLEDITSAVYLAIAEHNLETEQDDSDLLRDKARDWFAIDTVDEYRAAYNTVARCIYATRAKGTAYDVDYSAIGELETEFKDAELYVYLEGILKEKEYLDICKLVIQGYDQKEIAEALGVSIITIKRRYSDLRERLKYLFHNRL